MKKTIKIFVVILLMMVNSGLAVNLSGQNIEKLAKK